MDTHRQAGRQTERNGDRQTDRHLRSLPFHWRNLSCLVSSLSVPNHSSLDSGGLMYGSRVSSPSNSTCTDVYTHAHRHTPTHTDIHLCLLYRTHSPSRASKTYGHNAFQTIHIHTTVINSGRTHTTQHRTHCGL